MDILITKNDIGTLMDIAITNLIHTNMVEWTSMTITHVMMITTQEKTQSYTEQTPRNDFIPLAIQMYASC